MWLLILTIAFDDRRYFWPKQNIEAFIGDPYHLNGFMTRPRFENILSELAFTGKRTHRYTD